MSERAARLVEAFGRELPGSGDHGALRAAAAEVLRARVRYDLGVWATVDPLTTMWTSCVLDGFDRDEHLERAVFDNEYRVPDVLKLRDLAAGPAKAGVLSIATGGDPQASARYREVLAPRGVADEVRLVFSVDGTAWGALVLLSTERPFDREDLAALQAVSRPFGLRLREALLASTAGSASDAAGVVLCEPDGRIVDLSPEAGALLEAAAPDGVPAAVGAAVVRFAALGVADSVAAAGGAWLTVRCTWLGGRVLAVVDRIDPYRLADVLIGAAGLTAREREVLEAILRGRTARAAAAGLRMSEHTLNDHLKRIFAKFGVSSRSELVARLFTDHYAVRHAAGATPSARGHYLAEPASSAR